VGTVVHILPEDLVTWQLGWARLGRIGKMGEA